jgi:ribokinase
MYKAGGKGGNQAVAAAQFGAQAFMIGRVGDDDFGKRLLSYLRSAKVDTKHVRIDPAAGSGMSVAIIDAEGDYGAVIVSGANLQISEEDVREALDVIQRAGVLVLQNEILDAMNLFAAQFARAHGVRVVLNAAPARPLAPKMLETVDILVVNAVEAEMMCGVAVASPAAAAEAATRLSSQATNVIVTAGGMGLAVAECRQPSQLQAAHAVNLVDTRRRRCVHRCARCPIGRGLLPSRSHPLCQCRGIAFCQHAADQKQSVTFDRVARFLSEIYHTLTKRHRMLKNISSVSPDLLWLLASMGHGEDLASRRS